MKRKALTPATDSADLTMDRLVESISQTHRHFSAQAGKAVNIALTLRNWVVGAYLREYEQRGQDRAQYGARLIDTVAERLSSLGVDGFAPRSLRLYRQFYIVYPTIWQSAPAISGDALSAIRIWQSLAAESQAPHAFRRPTSAGELLDKLSFTHLAELIQIEDADQRAFYETECMRGVWSVRELKRQIASLYYQRSALSTDKAKLAAMAQANAAQAAIAPAPAFPIRDPYVFEFLGLKPMEVMSESHLEDPLLDHLQTFSHEAAGQLNTYVTWYARHMMSEGDNPPIGILLCTQKDHALAEYALAGMDNQLFVSRYQLELPSREVLQGFLEQQLKDA